MYSSPRRRSNSPVPIIVAVVVGVLLIGGITWLWLQTREEASPPPAATAPGGSPTPAPGFSPDLDAVPPLDLPELSASDAFIRDLVSGLSSNPQLARWLVTDDLVQRFVGVVVDLAGNSNPAANLPAAMAPQEDFSAVDEGGRTVISPESYRRFDLVAATLVSMDTGRTVELYRQVRPLVDEAYGQLGIPYSFDETLALAIRNVLAAPVPETPPEVVGSDGIYVFADPALEGRRGAEKLMLRMGPANARRVQGKLAEFAAAMGLEP